MIPSIAFTATTPGNSLILNPIRRHIEWLNDFRTDCVNALSRPYEGHYDDLETFWDIFFVPYPEYQPYTKMAELAGIGATTMRDYYLGKRPMPEHAWHRLLINAIKHIEADLASIAITIKNYDRFLPQSLKAINNIEARATHTARATLIGAQLRYDRYAASQTARRG